MDHCVAATLLLLIQPCLCHFSAPKSELKQNETDILRHLAKIKQEILRHLGDSPRYNQTTPTYRDKKNNQESDVRVTQDDKKYKLTNIASYHSEPPGMF